MTNNTQAILELREVSKTYPSSDFELDRISFSLPYRSIAPAQAKPVRETGP
ncbi:MAG: hypothetical protein Q4A78_00705 [Peptostreptococcaceae bacterium]|nr:hypothetical protein [Peptostreptococcaceae bacterium]